MNPLVECVPNFSEGRNQNIIQAIADSISKIKGVKLLNVEPDKDYNRTVVTFVGSPDAVVEAAFQATKTASLLIDMRAHKGEHPRLGATDVVPFVPVSGIGMQECVELSKRFGKRVASELDIPIYLYEYAATVKARKNLADIRKGEYEGLQAKLSDPEWKPDYGKAEMNLKSGATVTGARKFLIAYNVNLDSSDSKAAHEIALRIREAGRPKKDADGNTIRDNEGKAIKIPGSLKAVKAMGVFLERFNIAQVSINLVDYEISPPHVAFEEVKKEATALGIGVTGSEIVGLIPLEALLVAGRHYAGGTGGSEKDLIHLAVERLGLSQLEPFEPSKKIIEYTLKP